MITSLLAAAFVPYLTLEQDSLSNKTTVMCATSLTSADMADFLGGRLVKIPTLGNDERL